MTVPATTASTAPDRADLRAEVEHELQLEDSRVLLPLLDRVTEIAESIASGQVVDADYIAVATRLWGRYVTEIRGQRVAKLFELFPLTPAAGPAEEARRHRFRPRARKEESKATPAETSTEAFSQLQAGQTRMEERSKAFESLLRDYRTGQFWSHEMLASLLRSSAFSDRAWAKFEEEFVLKYLDEHPSARADAEVRETLAALSEARRRLELELEPFLLRSVPALAAPPKA